MTLRKSEAIFRLVVGIALALGFVGFATHSQVAHHVSAPSTLVAPASATPAMVASAPACDDTVGL